MAFPSTGPHSTIPHEMITRLKIANWPIVLEKTELTDAQKHFGGSIGSQGDASEYEQWLCLYQRDDNDGWVLWLTSGEIDGGYISGFVWLHVTANQKIDSRCKKVSTKLGGIELPIQLHLGTTRTEVENLLGQPSGKFRNTFMYEHEHKLTIRQEPYMTMNSIYIVYQEDIVRVIQVEKTTQN
jgi:hypothetical protein